MTRQRTFKRRVRERMAKTGESYTAARRMLIATGDRPEAAAAQLEPPVADERVVEATGRGWEAWFDEGVVARAPHRAEVAARGR